jgi:hypothetical protein
MKRMTHADWDVINSALAYFQAGSPADVGVEDIEEGSEQEEDWYRQIAETRDKVHDRR